MLQLDTHTFMACIERILLHKGGANTDLTAYLYLVSQRIAIRTLCIVYRIMGVSRYTGVPGDWLKVLMSTKGYNT